MKFPIENNQFAARLTGEDLILVNELVPDLLPDRDLTDTSITGREIFMAMAETASLKLRKINQSKPEDLKMIEDLTASLTRINEDRDIMINVLNIKTAKIQEHEQEIERLNDVINALNVELNGIETENTVSKDRVLKLEKYVPVTNEMRIVLEPLTHKVLLLYAEKMQIRRMKEVTPGKILTTLFVYYLTKRLTEFPEFPFLISEKEFISLKKELDSEQ